MTLPEVLVASIVIGSLVAADLAAVYQTRLLNAKDADHGVIGGFMQHYVEMAKALPFDQLRTNTPLSGLYSGEGGSPRVAIPANSEWISLVDTNYTVFHPSLNWVTNRNPRMRAQLVSSSVGGILHDKHLQLEVEWQPPFRERPLLRRRLDLYRVKDL